jgi:hypothetical protein
VRDKIPAGQPGSHALFVGSEDAYAAWQRSLRICDGESPEQVLQAVIDWFCAGPEWWVTAGPYPGPWGQARVYRIRPARSLLVLGETPMADELRQLLEAGAAPGWILHPVPDRRTALGDLGEPLREASGSWLAHNILARAGFQYAEEIAALPQGGLQDLPQCGPKCLTAIRQVLNDFGFDTASDAAGQGSQQESGDPIGPAPVSAVFIDSLQTLAEWAAREHAATSVGDIIHLAFERADLPSDVAECWDRVREHSLQSLTRLSGPVNQPHSFEHDW